MVPRVGDGDPSFPVHPKLIGEFMTQLELPQAFWAFLYKMAARGHFVFPIDAKNHRVLVIRDLNGYGEYEFDR